MKKLITIAALVLSNVLGGSEPKKVPEKDAVPEAGFPDHAALQAWSGTSSFGGGWSEKLDVAGQEVFYTSRSGTSGRASTELIFWTKMKDRILPCLIVPLRFAEYRVSVENQGIVVKCWDAQAKAFREVMRLQASFFDDLPRAARGSPLNPSAR